MKHVFPCLFIFFTLFSLPAFPSTVQALTVFNNQLMQLASVLHETPMTLETLSDPMLQELEDLVKKLDAKKMPKNLQEYGSSQENYPKNFYDYAQLINSSLQGFLRDDLSEKYIIFGGTLADLPSWKRDYYEQIRRKIAAKKRGYETQLKDMVNRVDELAIFLKRHLQQVIDLRNGNNVELLLNYEVSLNTLILFLENWILAQQSLFQPETLATHENFLMGDFVVQVIIETYFEDKNFFHLRNPFNVIKAVIDNKGDLKKIALGFIEDYPLNALMVEKIRNIMKRQENPTMDKAHCEIIKSWNERVRIPYFDNISDLPQCALA